MALKATEIVRIEAELVIVRTAKQAIAEGGQSVSIGDLSYTEVNYSALVAREKSLEIELARVNGSRPRILPVSFSGMYK